MSALFEAVFGFLMRLVWQLVIGVVVWLVALALAFIVGTPFLLIGAAFARGGYFSSVGAGYRRIWRRMGEFRWGPAWWDL